MSIMPSAYLSIAERLGYQVDKVGNRRVINCKAALAAHSGTSIAGNSANAGSASSQETSLEVGKSSSMSQGTGDLTGTEPKSWCKLTSINFSVASAKAHYRNSGFSDS
jgi:hypothetical protein